MTVRSAIATIVGCSLLIAAIGASVGYALGTLAPEYYRSVFRGGREPAFDPVSVGVGQGLTQGTAGGLVVGLAVVALFCLRDGRLRRIEGLPAPANSMAAKSWGSARRVLLAAGATLALGFCLCSGVVVGLLMGEQGAYHRRFLEEQEAIAAVLASDPAFAGVQVHKFSAGGVYLSGKVSTPEDLGRLRARVTQAIGEQRAREAILVLSVRP